MKTEKEKMLLGELYNGRDQELIKERKKTKERKTLFFVSRTQKDFGHFLKKCKAAKAASRSA